MFEIVSNISNWALGVIGTTGYSGIFVLSALESVAIPIPSEVVVPFSGFLASSGVLNIWAVILVATLANLMGSIVLFWIGKSGGRWILDRYGKYVFIRKQDMDRGDKWFAKYGSKAVFWSRMLPVVRTFISLPAGVSKMNFSRFCSLTFLGSLPWNAGLAFVGYKTGENWDVLHDYFRSANVVIGALIIVLIGWYVWRHLKNRHV